jgi:hypothetical protein
MISPKMFDEFVYEDMNSSYEYVDHGIYHLDGEEEIMHLDSMLKMEKLKLVQWVPSTRVNEPNYQDPMNWIPLFRKIQEAGKSVLINCPYQRVTELLDKIDRDKVYLSISCPDEKTALKTLKNMEKAGKR